MGISRKIFSSHSFSGVLIRRKKSDPNPLRQVFVPPILSAQTPTKFIIEVANSAFFFNVFLFDFPILIKPKIIFMWYVNLAGGTVRIYAESDKLEPIASVFDPIVIPVNYVSFCGYDNLVRFYYDCNWKWTVHTAHCTLWHRSIFLISLNSLFNNIIYIHLSKLYHTIQIPIVCVFFFFIVSI